MFTFLYRDPSAGTRSLTVLASDTDEAMRVFRQNRPEVDILAVHVRYSDATRWRRYLPNDERQRSAAWS